MFIQPEASSVTHDTFTLTRSFPVAPARVFAAFADPVAKRRWFLGGGGHTMESYEFDFRVGGSERGSFRVGPESPLPNLLCEILYLFLDIAAGQRIVCAGTMVVEGRVISASLITFEFLPTGAGTDLLFTHQAAFFPPCDGAERRKAGWAQLLEGLAREVAE